MAKICLAFGNPILRHSEVWVKGSDLSAVGVDRRFIWTGPPNVFASPDLVLKRTDLSAAQKIEILRRWEYDACIQEVAEEEGMPGPYDGLLRRIHIGLAALGAEMDIEHEPPAKQGGL